MLRLGVSPKSEASLLTFQSRFITALFFVFFSNLAHIAHLKSGTFIAPC